MTSPNTEAQSPPPPAYGWAAAAALIALSLIWSLYRYWDTPSPDLMATWLAGHFYGLGQFDQIYPVDTSVYTMNPPTGWWPYLQSIGYSDPVFPFVYPPIWAALMAPVARWVSFDQLQLAAQLINPVLIGLTVVLAGRVLRTRLPVWVFLAIGLALLHFTLIGIVALEQDQPQILVSFLILLGLERAAAGKPWMAGAAMALAAAIKLYPLFFALVWLLRGQRRAALSFVLFGALLAALSVALAGWPLHQAFLAEVRVISATAFSNKIVFSIDPLIARIFAPERLIFVPATDDPRFGWSVMQKNQIWRILSLVALLASVIVTARIKSPLAWPILAILIGLFSPLSWGYHYITAVAFAPIFAQYLSRRGAVATLGVIFLPMTTGVIGLMALADVQLNALPTVGTACVAALGLAFSVLYFRRQALTAPV